MEDLFNGGEAVPSDKLSLLTDLCSKYRSVATEIEELAARMKELQETHESISRTQIPSIFNELGLSEIRLASGEKVSVEDKLKASIADKNYLFAFKSMVEAEGGDENAEAQVRSLFKSKIIVDSDDTNEELLDVLLSLDIPYDVKHDIHHLTLAKYCKGRLGAGKPIPEGISVFQYQETKITK